MEEKDFKRGKDDRGWKRRYSRDEENIKRGKVKIRNSVKSLVI